MRMVIEFIEDLLFVECRGINFICFLFSKSWFFLVKVKDCYYVFIGYYIFKEMFFKLLILGKVEG